MTGLYLSHSVFILIINTDIWIIRYIFLFCKLDFSNRIGLVKGNFHCSCLILVISAGIPASAIPVRGVIIVKQTECGLSGHIQLTVRHHSNSNYGIFDMCGKFSHSV